MKYHLITKKYPENTFPIFHRYKLRPATNMYISVQIPYIPFHITSRNSFEKAIDRSHRQTISKTYLKRKKKKNKKLIKKFKMSRRILRPKKQTLCMRNCDYENAYRITIPKQLVLENHNHNFGTNIYKYR